MNDFFFVFGFERGWWWSWGSVRWGPHVCVCTWMAVVRRGEGVGLHACVLIYAGISR